LGQERKSVTAAQVRAARSLLGWTVRQLAEAADVSPNTVTRAEKEGSRPGYSATTIRRTLEAAGVVFIEENGGGAGVRLAAPEHRER